MVDETTGIQTIRQMMFLVDMVSSEGLVEPSAVRTASEYKRQYLEHLMATVNARMASVRDGSRPVAAFTVPGAVALLEQFHGAGVELILTSGTDQDDVEKEAALLGYGCRFSSIHGSQGDEIGDAKRLVMQRLLAGRQALAGIVVFGDGSVEIAEGRHAGAVTVGIANDEDIPGKLCNDKRRRLIRAGADWIVPDFTETSQLIGAIHGD
jgi:phosphoglycolate phosphatase-like HAD superfamily hydrolase